MKRLILGSQSPRRKEILSYFSLPFEQASPPFDEEAVPYKGDPRAYAMELSSGKASSLVHTFPDRVILTADTVVQCGDKIYNKPKDLQEAVSFLTDYSGKWHSVFTAVSVRQGQFHISSFEETKVLCNPLTSEQIHQFLSAIVWKDKGGGYSIQGIGSLLVNKIEGCYYNVTGLPVNTVRKLLLEVGIDLWQYLK